MRRSSSKYNSALATLGSQLFYEDHLNLIIQFLASRQRDLNESLIFLYSSIFDHICLFNCNGIYFENNPPHSTTSRYIYSPVMGGENWYDVTSRTLLSYLGLDLTSRKLDILFSNSELSNSFMMGRNSSLDYLADINENNIYSLSRSQVNKLFLAAVAKFPDFFSFHALPNSLQESTFESRIDCLLLILDNAARLRNLWLENNICFLEFMADCIYWLWDQELSFDNFLCLNCDILITNVNVSFTRLLSIFEFHLKYQCLIDSQDCVYLDSTENLSDILLFSTKIFTVKTCLIVI